jgi:hypothetical protein
LIRSGKKLRQIDFGRKRHERKRIAFVRHVLRSLPLLCECGFQMGIEKRKESSSNVCHMQTSNTRPQRGDLLSSQDTHPKICEDAKKFFDSSLSDPKKCWSFDKASAKACEDDKVKIVPESAKRRM